MAYTILPRMDGWFDVGKNFPPHSAPEVIYGSKQKLKRVLAATGSAPSLSGLKENLDCMLEELDAVSLLGFDGRPYFHGREIRIAPSAAMPEYCILGEILSGKAYAARLRKMGNKILKQGEASNKVERRGGVD